LAAESEPEDGVWKVPTKVGDSPIIRGRGGDAKQRESRVDRYFSLNTPGICLVKLNINCETDSGQVL